jgi:hypothetical protein
LKMLNGRWRWKLEEGWWEEKNGTEREKKGEEEYDKGARSKSLGICRMTRSRIRC